MIDYINDRWYNHLNPNIVKTAWSPMEDKIIIEEHFQKGLKWAEIAKKVFIHPSDD